MDKEPETHQVEISSVAFEICSDLTNYPTYGTTVGEVIDYMISEWMARENELSEWMTRENEEYRQH